MSTKTLWLIAGSAAILVAVVVLITAFVVPADSDAAPTPTASASASPTPSATDSATPTVAPTPTPTPPPSTVVATCENTSTALFRSMMSSNGWISWETQDQLVGSQPFASFPNGPPSGQIICRWGADPDLATDNIIDLAWSPIDPENAVAAIQMLTEQGFTRADAPEGVYLSLRGPPGYTDAAGWGETYLFGMRDVRWAIIRQYVQDYVKAPTEAD